MHPEMLKNYYSVKDIAIEAKKIFGELFSEKLFREQLAFHGDIDYSEPVEYLDGFYAEEQDLKCFLIDKSLEAL